MLKDLTLNMSHEERKTLAKYVDSNQDGKIDVKEFTAAFKVRERLLYFLVAVAEEL